MKARNLFLFLLAPLALASCGGHDDMAGLTVYGLAKASTTEAVSYSGKMATGVNYQIFVCSFADSNGDGVGDLKGIEQHLDYLAELGVHDLWLSPIHPSSTYHKYNVRDYYAVDENYGSMADFESLVAKAKSKGIGIVLDMVFNHSAIDHPWFAKALEDYAYDNEGEGSYKDLYSLADDPKDLRPGTSSSRNIGGRQVYYECNFESGMPEFNLDSDLARRFHAEIMDFWLKKGVAGFRFDGVAYYYYGKDAKCVDYCKYLYETAKSLKDDVYLVGEYWVNNQPALNKMGESGMTAFNFPTSGTMESAVNAVQRGNGYDYAWTLENAETAFLTKSEGKTLPSFFLSNHDQDRWVGSRTAEVARAVAAANILTPGTPYLYYGEEIMMRGVRQSGATDANRRLPMQWFADASQDTARTKRLKEADYSGAQTELGAIEAIKQEGSITSYYKQFIHFRNAHPELQKGFYRNVTDEESPLLAFRIDYAGKEYVLVENVDDKDVAVQVGEGYELATGLYDGLTAYRGGKVKLPAYTCALLANA